MNDFKKVRVGDLLSNRLTEAQLLVHEIDLTNQIVHAVESFVINRANLDNWDFIQIDYTEKVINNNNLTKDIFDNLRLGDMIRNQTSGKGFFVSATNDDVIFVSRYLALYNPDEWEIINNY